VWLERASFPIPHSVHSWICAFCNKLLNQSVSLSFVSHASKLIKHEKRVVGTLIYSQLVEGRTSWELLLAPTEGGESWALSPRSVGPDALAG
jgi:hypothetical protein